MADAKPASKSRTIIINSVLILGGVATEMGAFLSDNWPEGTEGPGAAVIVVGIVNIVLRLVTKSPILFPKK